jgi:hypothetical protein
MTKTKTIETINQLMEELQGELARVEKPHLNLWFRGQSRADWKLLPKVFRPDFVKDPKKRIEKERFLNQDFRVRSAGIRKGTESDAELYFLQQHYGMPTRLLDWSTSPLAALFFALGGNVDSDGKLFAMDAPKLGPTQNALQPNGKEFQGIATSNHSTFQHALKVLNVWSGDFPRYIFPVRPDHFDRRITLQQSCFTFHSLRPDEGSAELNTGANRTLREFIIPKDKKPNLTRELASLNINTFSIYGDLENLAKWLVEAHGDM